MQSTAPPTSVPLAFGASAANIATIPTASQIGVTAGAASLTDGFPPQCFLAAAAGGVAPRGADFNGILNLISQSVVWTQAGGSFVYNATYQTSIGGYPKGAMVQRTDLSGWWISQTENNGTNPEIGGAGWLPFNATSSPTTVALSSAMVTPSALQAARGVILLTGALTANVSVVLPNWAGMQWLISNTCTGSFTVTVKTAAGTGVVVSAGQTYVYGDGTNITLASALPADLASSVVGKGSKLIAFIQRLTGAVARWVEDKLNDAVSVKDFGAVGDGTTDDTNAARLAFASGANCIRFTAGTYNLTGNLPMTGNGKGVLLIGDGMENTILYWSGTGMTGVDGISYTNTVAQVPFTVQDMTIVCVPNPASALVIGGSAVKLVYPPQQTVYMTTVHFIRVQIRAGFTGTTWAPTLVGGWTTTINCSEAGKLNLTNCHLSCNINTGTTYGIQLYSAQNPDYVVIRDCDFIGFHKPFYVTGPSSFGGLVVSGCDFESCNYGLDVAIATDLIQVTDSYFQCYTTGVRTLARTSKVRGNRFDMVNDPRARYAPAVAEGVVLGNGSIAIDAMDVSGNHFGGNATTKNAVHATSGVSYSNVRDNTVGDTAAYGTTYATGVLLDAGCTNITVTGNTKIAATRLVTDNGSNNYVYGNLPGDGAMNITGATPALKSGVANVTLGELVYLTQAGATNVTNFTNGFLQQRIMIIAGDALSTINHNTNIRLAGSVNWTMPGNATLTLVFDGTYWREQARMVP